MESAYTAPHGRVSAEAEVLLKPVLVIEAIWAIVLAFSVLSLLHGWPTQAPW